MIGKSIAALLFLCFISVASEATATPFGRKQTRPILFVICDFSSSQKAKGIAMITSKALTVFKKMSDKYDAYFYDVSSPIFDDEFYKSEAPVLVRASDYRQWEKAKEDREQELLRKLDSMRKYSTRRTCILTAIDKVMNRLAANPAYKNVPVRVLVISDMLEDCSYEKGAINIDKGSYRKAFEKLGEMSKPVETFKGYRDVLIQLIGTSQFDNKQLDLLNEFWKKVLERYSYKLAAPISPVLPEWAK